MLLRNKNSMLMITRAYVRTGMWTGVWKGGGSVGRWVGGSVGRWVGGSVGCGLGCCRCCCRRCCCCCCCCCGSCCCCCCCGSCCCCCCCGCYCCCYCKYLIHPQQCDLAVHVEPNVFEAVYEKFHTPFPGFELALDVTLLPEPYHKHAL